MGKNTEAADARILEGPHRFLGPAVLADAAADDGPIGAIDHFIDVDQAVVSGPNAGEVGRPTLVECAAMLELASTRG